MTDDKEKLRKIASGAKNRVRDRLSDLWWWFLIRGVLALGVAVFALFWPQQTVGLLVNLLGAYLVFDGVMGVIGTFRAGAQGSVSMVAIIGLLVGAVLLFWTGLSVRLFLILVGAWALIQGVGLFISSRDREADPESRNLVGIVGVVLALSGLVLAMWPNTGVVTVSWLLATVALVLGCVMIFVAVRLRRVTRRIRKDG